MTIKNIPLARKVLEYAEQEHEDFTFNMGTWYTKTRRRDERGRFMKGKCDTAACLAGTVTMLVPEVQHIDAWGVMMGDHTLTHMVAATRLLGITEGEAYDLFWPSSYVDEYPECFDDSDNTYDHAKVNAAAIERFTQMIEKAEQEESANGI